MTLKTLYDRFAGLRPAGPGHYKVTFSWHERGVMKKISCTTNNVRAIDRIGANVPDRANYLNRTYKQALMELYDEANTFSKS